MLAAHTPLPVIGVPVPIGNLQGVDALLSIVQMPAGVPVATVAIGQARNAALLAVQILATSDEALLQKVIAYKAELAEASRVKNDTLQAKLGAQGAE
jgi:5-(carboxyamino)imidazole ribonucleotide mutase